MRDGRETACFGVVYFRVAAMRERSDGSGAYGGPL